MAEQTAILQVDAEQQTSDYDKWFREQVEEGLREADDPNTVWVSHEQVMKDLDELRHEWRSGAEKERNVA